jgi:hypothetical protein
VNSTQLPIDSKLPASRSISTIESTTIQDNHLVTNKVFAAMITHLVRRIRGRVLSRKMRVTPAALLYFKEHAETWIARAILRSIRQPVVDIISSEAQFTTSQ